MAGSYSHVVTNKRGKLVNFENFKEMVDTPGDAYETVEEMYGMIHYLARKVENLSPADNRPTHEEVVEEARKNYVDGLTLSPGRQNPDKRVS